jgi:hypothetical protein
VLLLQFKKRLNYTSPNGRKSNGQNAQSVRPVGRGQQCLTFIFSPWFWFKIQPCSFRAHHPVDRDDRHLLAHAMDSDLLSHIAVSLKENNCFFCYGSNSALFNKSPLKIGYWSKSPKIVATTFTRMHEPNWFFSELWEWETGSSQRDWGGLPGHRGHVWKTRFSGRKARWPGRYAN